VSQLQQELTFQEIDESFDQWGADSSHAPSESSDDDSSTQNFQNIYTNNIRQSAALPSRSPPFIVHSEYVEEVDTPTPRVQNGTSSYNAASDQDQDHNTDTASRLQVLSSKLIKTER
jgi:hypothetical protein